MEKIKSMFEMEYENYLNNLEKMVNIDCPTDYKIGVDKVREYIIAELNKFITPKYKMEVFKEKNVGDHLLVTRNGEIQGKILILAHMDTVFPVGTVKERAFKIEGNKAYGPGVSDMKHGISSILTSLKIIDALNLKMKTIQILFNSDEETGSETSRKYIEKYASSSDTVIIMESGGEKGELITARKGIGRYVIKVYGKSSHAGAAFEEGKNAVVELSNKILEISKLTDLNKGITVNVGLIKGGTATNIVPDYAEASVDVRCFTKKDMLIIDEEINKISKKVTEGFSCEVCGGINRPPLEETKENIELFNIYKNISEGIGEKCEKSYSGGGTDGNFTSGIGIPTIDGLAPIGGKAHTDQEYLELDSIITKNIIFIKFLLSI